MRWKGPLDAKWLRRWTIRLGLAAWFVLALPVFTVVAMISIVGIPLALAMMVTPFLFTVVALANLVQRGHGRDGAMAVVTSIALALLLLAGVAGLCNAVLDRRAEEFLAGDVDTLERPLRVESLGLFGMGWQDWWGGKKARCSELCQRLLLSGAVERVIVADWKPGQEGADWDVSTKALGYRLEQRETCPPIQLPGGRAGMDPVDDAKPDEAMRMAVASGRCLVEEPATLGEADAVVTTGCLHRGDNDYSTGLSLLGDTVRADRASVSVREQGRFVERYRWTGVRVLKHFVVPFPTLIGGTELNMAAGFARDSERRNTRGFAKEEVDSVRFVRDELGLDVTIPAATAEASPAALIARGLDAPGPVSPALQQVIEDLFDSFVQGRQMDEATRGLALRALADPRVAPPRDTWALAKGCAKAGDAVNAQLAGILFARLATTDPSQRENDPDYLGYPASYLATAIAMLPPQAVLPHRRELEELARDPARRLRARAALKQLPVFGAGTTPTLLFLVEEGCALKEAAATRPEKRSSRRDVEDWQDVLQTGLSGLCRLGTDASPALAPLLERLHDGRLPVAGANRELLLTTLVRLGADSGQLRGRFLGDASSKADDEAERFDRVVARARTRPDCAY